MQRAHALALSAIVFVLLTPSVVIAQFSGSQVFDYVWVKTFKFERSWVNQPNLLVINVIIPTIAIYAVFLGLLRSIRLLEGMGSSMEHLIAVLVAMAALFFGGIGYIAGLLAFMGHFSVVIFFILFMIGAILYSRGLFRKRRAIDIIYGGFKRDLAKLNKDIENFNKKAEAARNEGFMENNQRKLDEAAKWEHLAERAREERRKLRESFKDAESA